MLRPVETIRLSEDANNRDANTRITSLRFNESDGSMLAAVDVKGRICTWRLGSTLSTLQPNELSVMEMMGQADSQDAVSAIQKTNQANKKKK
jgi:hypothetical protein